MLHFKMYNISNFAQISSVMAQRSTAPTRLLLSSRPGKGLLSDIQAKCCHLKIMDTLAGRRASALGTIDYMKKNVDLSLTCGPKQP